MDIADRIGIVVGEGQRLQMAERVIPQIPIQHHLHFSAGDRAYIVDNSLPKEKDEIKSDEPLYSSQGPFTDKMIQRVPVEQRISGVDRARYPAEQDHADDPEAVWIEIRKQFRDAEKGKSFLFFVFVHASPPFRHISSVHLWFTHQCRHLRSASLSAREPISTQAVRRRL